VRTTPPHLFDSGSLYREDNTFSGNLVTVQRFYYLPFTLDLHFGYRDSAFAFDEMSMEETTLAIE
jgi:hypothetical protein